MDNDDDDDNSETHDFDPDLENQLIESGAYDTPADRWDRVLADLKNPTPLAEALDILLAKGCSRIELLDRLEAIQRAHYREPIGKRDRKRMVQAANYLASKFFVIQLTELAELAAPMEWEEHKDWLRQLAKNIEHFYRTRGKKRAPQSDELIKRLISYVRRRTGRPHFRELTTLLRGCVDPKLKSPYLRKKAERTELTGPPPSKPPRPARSTKGRPAAMGERQRARDRALRNQRYEIGDSRGRRVKK